ncbi:MAG: hypothetical protein JXB14_05860 [Candidatus Altiarchaeota archaeon]|nr:hypothetical protein [Candidatus Altiarchaeota archaeon]
MEKRGVGNLFEILFAVIVVVIVATFYSKDLGELMPMMFILIGGILILAGAVNKESDVVTGGILLLGLAIVYAEAVIK